MINKSVEYITTNRGTEALLRGGFEYYKRNVLKGGSSTWACKNRTYKCAGTLKVYRDQVIRETVHTHGCKPDSIKIEIKKAIAACRRRAAETDENLRVIFDEEFSELKRLGRNIPYFDNVKYGLMNARKCRRQEDL